MAALRIPAFGDREKAVDDLVYNTRLMHNHLPKLPEMAQLESGSDSERLAAAEAQIEALKEYLQNLRKFLVTGS